MDLNAAKEKAFNTAKERGQYKFDGSDTFRALKHAAGEIVEANEEYNNWSLFDNNEGKREAFENELADVVICILSICGYEQIDIEKAIVRKMKINEKRVGKNEVQI